MSAISRSVTSMLNRGLTSKMSRGFATQIYHAGLKNTKFSNSLEISKESEIIPIFRVMNYDGEIEGNWKNPFTDDQMVENYKFMVRLSVWDDMMYNIQRQGRISFYIQNMGEEAAQTGVGSALTTDDPLWCQYRELGVLMWRGFTIEDALDQLFATEGDEGKGRQMPISYTKKNINLPSIATPLTTQVPHSAGAGYAHKLAGEKRCSVGFFGEGAASEGDFHAALNFAAVLKSQTIFICRNNGYAISTPVKDQYAGDGIAIRGKAYGMETVRVDGNDLLATHIATREARKICVERSEPVLIELMTYRMGHHSTSDDASQYRPAGEYDAWNQSGVNPITRVRRYLEAKHLWNQDMDSELRKEAKSIMLQAIKVAEKKKKCPILPGIFDDVLYEKTWNIIQQEKELKQHLEEYKQYYDTSMYRQ